MAAGVAAILITVAKWAAGIGATVIATDMLDRYYQENKGKIGKTWDKWIDELEKTWEARWDNDMGSGRIELLDKPTNENTTVTGKEKEQTNGLQGSMDYTEFFNWLRSAEGQKFLNETAPKIRAEGLQNGNTSMNADKHEQIDSIQGNYDAGTYQDSYKSDLTAIKNLTAKPGMFEFTEDETIGEMLPNPGQEEEYDKDTGQGFNTPTEPGNEIVDKTDENLGTNTIDWIKWAEQEQEKRWARDDAIMKHTEEREDNAWQRSVADMKKAGINPNLINVQPAQSGGGITQSSGQNIAGVTSQMNIDLQEMQQLIDQAFKGNENDKDRFMQLFDSVVKMLGFIAMMRK